MKALAAGLPPGTRWRMARFPSGKHPTGNATARDRCHPPRHCAWYRRPRAAASMGLKPCCEPHPTWSARLYTLVATTRNARGYLEASDLSRWLPMGYGPDMSLPHPASSLRALTCAVWRKSDRQWPSLHCTIRLATLHPGYQRPSHVEHSRPLYGLLAGLEGYRVDGAGGHGLHHNDGRIESMRDDSEAIIGVSLFGRLMEVYQPVLEDTAGALLNHSSGWYICNAIARIDQVGAPPGKTTPVRCGVTRSHSRERVLRMTSSTPPQRA
jgi:hypothetical protein